MDEFFNDCQEAVTEWGRIVLATGGYLKAAKCFWYMMAWKWVKGMPILRSLSQLPKYKMTIPQKSGTPVKIPLRCVTDAQKTLGVWSCPSGDFGFHLNKKWRRATYGSNVSAVTGAQPRMRGWAFATRFSRSSPTASQQLR